jgi:hypothetical protein
MSNQPGFFVQRESDNKLLEVFSELCKENEQIIFQVSIALSTNDSVNINRNRAFDDFYQSPLIQGLTGENTYLVNRITLRLKNHTITFIRGELLETPSPLFDYIQSQNTNSNVAAPQVATPEQKLDISKFLQDKLCSVSTPQLLSSNLPAEYEALLSQHNSMLSKLEQLNSDLLVKTQEKSQDLESSYQEKLRALENKYSEKSDELEQIYSSKTTTLNDDHSALISEVEERNKELDERASQLDDRDNTHVRREIRDKMLDDVKSRIDNFGVSEATGNKRTPVFTGMLFLIITFGLLLAYTIWEAGSVHKETMFQLEAIRNVSALGVEGIDKLEIKPETWAKVSATDVDRSALYWLWMRMAIFSFGLIGSILYYIKWQNRWAENHSDSEFQLQQFYIDVNRANWAIESCLEWRKETDSAIPTVLLDSITKNLFSNDSKDLEQVVHPSDELASALLGSASKLKMNVAGNEIEIDKPGKIKPKSKA